MPNDHSRHLWEIVDRVRTVGGRDASQAMADLAVTEIKANLNRRSHAPDTQTSAPRGGPPARISGRLMRSVFADHASRQGERWVTVAGSRGVIYAHVQEFGKTIHRRNAPFLVWRDEHGLHFARQVYIPPRPFVHYTVGRLRQDGRLTRAGEAAFRRAVFGG